MKRMFWNLDNEMGLGFFIPILQLVKLCTIGFALAFQGSQGFVISPSPSFLPVIPPREGTPGLVHYGESWGTPGPLPQIDSGRPIASSSPAVPNGLFLHPPITLSPPTLASIPQKVNVIEPSLSPSPSTITSSPPYKVVASPSTVQVHVPPLVQPSSTQRKGPGVRPAVSTPVAPAPHSSPTIAIPVNAPSVHPVISAVSPSKPTLSQVSPAPSPFKFAPQPAKTPFLPPKASASGSFSKSPKTPFLPQVQALLPPPPNEDCLSTVCTEPYTNSPSGAPCRCVWPMQVGLRLSVSLYTFFPLDTELASEIAAEVFMKQSQVRIMGANVASQQTDKTVVLIDLVPLGEKFDSTTAFLTFERFWHKQVLIKPSYFGDYEVLYVRYPGLPPSPPLPPSSITMIDGATYSNDRNNGRTIKPLGVDVQKRQYKDGLSGGIIAIITLSVFVAVVLCSATSWVLLKCKDHSCQPASIPKILPPLTKAQAGSLIGGGPGSISSSFHSSMAAYMGSAKTFSVTDIERATDNFHDSRILGEGGFGRVYSAILEDGTKVAVKVLKREDRHGDREFLAEVEMLSRLHHRNLVKLIGISTEDSFRCLVYELISNGSVESHLHGVDKETSPLDWGARMKIALGAARGLAYLHEDSSPGVIHRDFKSSNILLEDDFTPKVSDFGLARTAMDEENRQISTHIMGTFGYVAPECAMTGHILVKSDVYSYGVVLLELLTGRKSVDMSQPPGQENLVTWARPLLASKEGLQVIIDPSLGSDVPFGSITKVAAIASMCVQPEVTNRPFMGEVVQALKLVYNECDEAIEAGSRSSSQEDLSVDLDMGVSSVSGQFPDNFLNQCSATNYDSAVDIERGLSMSELFSSSARFGGQVSRSFKRQAYSGPLRTGRSRRLWQIIRRFSGGSVSEHGTMFKF